MGVTRDVRVIFGGKFSVFNDLGLLAGTPVCLAACRVEALLMGRFGESDDELVVESAVTAENEAVQCGRPDLFP